MARLKFVLLLLLTLTVSISVVGQQEQPAPATDSAETASGEQVPPGTDDPAQPDTGPGPEPEEVPIAEFTLEQLETALAEVRAAIESAEPATEPSDEAEPPERLARLRDIENAIQRRITAGKRLDEVLQAVARVEQQLQDFATEGLETAPPYTIAFLDDMRDQLLAAQREVETDTLAVETAESLLGQAKDRLARAERRRREIRDQLETAREDAARAQLERQLEVAQLEQRLAEHDAAHAAKHVEVAQQELALSQRQAALLEQKVDAVKDQVVFTRSQLDEQLTELQTRQDRLQSELRDLHRTDTANQSRLADARERLEQARGEEQIRVRTEALAAREAWAQASSRGVELLQQRLDFVARARTLWERRFALRQGANAAELAEWDRETRELLNDTERRRAEIERRLQDLRTRKPELQTRLGNPETAADAKPEIESRIRALETREQHATDYLASLLQLERLAQRLLTDINRKRAVDSFAAVWSRIRLHATDLWQRELFAIDDRAFRLGALTRSGLLFVVAIAVAWAMRRILRRTLIRHLRTNAARTETGLDDILLAVVRQTRTFVVVLLALYIAIRTLPLSGRMQSVLDALAIIVVVFQAATWGSVALKNVIERTKRRRVEEDPSSVSAFGLMGFFGRVGIWSVALLITLDNLGFDITTLIAGLGVGGIAIAFALQNILGDVFCSIAILLDKPFVVGDFIIVNDLMGSVEHIGIKTTRLRSLGGEQIVFSNADLLSSRIRNYKRMYERRVLFSFGIVYETDIAKIEAIPGMIREIIESIDEVRFDRAHFKEYGDFALTFEVVYYVLNPDYNVYMDIQQQINVRMFRAFKEQGIAFAYPTRELIIRGDGSQGHNKPAGFAPRV